ncbi:hypothetical protein RB653_004525 [Dictyostelium firmibasis]|uniref:Calponin-homology (CH) domain-containing protein n=1 Tax=Dictyostelium firmibasis TaxID=79012 RepID=A0AAN7YY98_9MYCE
METTETASKKIITTTTNTVSSSTTMESNPTTTTTTGTNQPVKEIDMSLFTGVTIFDDSFDDDEIESDSSSDEDNNNNIDDNNNKNKNKNKNKNTNDGNNSNNNNNNNKSTIILKKWMNEYYKDIESYRNQRNQRYDSFVNELSLEENEYLTAEEIKNLTVEHYQKETSYLRLKRKLNQKEFQPLFKYGKLNTKLVAHMEQDSKSPQRKSTTFSPQGSLSPPSNISPSEFTNNNNNNNYNNNNNNNKKQNRHSTKLTPTQQQLYMNQSQQPPQTQQEQQPQPQPQQTPQHNNEFNGGTVYFNNPTITTPKNNNGGLGSPLSSSTGMSPPMTPMNQDEGFDRSNYRRTKSISSMVGKRRSQQLENSNNGSIDGGSTIKREFQNFTPLKNLNVQKNKSYTMMFKLDHKVILEQTEKLLEEKEKDTRMAAEIGQSLLEKNEDLEEEMKALKQRLQEQEALNDSLKLFNQQVDKLKNENAFLSNQVSTAKQENEILVHKEFDLSNQLDEKNSRLKSIIDFNSPMKTKTIKQQKEEIQELKLAVEGLQSSQGKLIKNRDRLLSANENLQNSVHDLKYQLDTKIDESEFEKLKSKVKLLRQKNKQLQIQVEQTQLSPESRSLKNPELILKSAYNDLIRNEELISSTPKITNLRVLSDARSLLSRLESEIINVDDCSLISTLISFLENDSNSISLNYTSNFNNNNSNQLISAIQDISGNNNNNNYNNNNNNNNNNNKGMNSKNNLLEKLSKESNNNNFCGSGNSILSGLNDSFESVGSSINSSSDSKSALYMLICIISINKYTKYDSNKRFKELSEEEEEEKNKLRLKVKELDKLNQELKDNFSSIQSHTRILQDQIDQLQLENTQLQQQLINSSVGVGTDSLADELRQSNIFEQQNDKQQQQQHEEEIRLIKEEMEKQLQSFSIQQQLSIQDKDKEIIEIKSEFQVKIIDLETLLEDRLILIKEYLTRIEELDTSVLGGEFKLNEKDKIIESIQQSINEKDLVISKHVESIHSIQELLEVKENQLIEKDLEIKVKTKQLHEKDQLILGFESSIIEKDQLIKEKSELIQRQSNDIIELETTSSTKDQLIREKDNLIKEKQQLIKDRDQTIQEKVEIINNQTTSINELQSVTIDKDKIIKEKLDSIEEKLSIIKSLESSSITKVEQFECSIVEKDQIISQLKQEIDSIHSNLSDSKLTQEQLKQEIEKLMMQFRELELQSQQRLELIKEKDIVLQQREKETLELNEKLSELQLKLTNITDIHSKCDSNLSTISFGLDERFNGLLDSFNHSLDRYQLKFNTLETKSKQSIKEKCLEVQQLLDQVKQLEQTIEQLKSTIQQLTQQHQQDQEKSELLIVELLDKKEEFDSIQIELTQLKSENQALLIKVEEKTRKHQVLKRELSMQMDIKKQEELELEKKRQLEEQINRIVKPTQSKDYYIEEEEPLINYVNTIGTLLADKHIQHVFPIDASKHIIHSFYDGVLLGKLVNFARDGTIDERVLNIEPTSNIEIDQNLNLVFNSAKAIGCVIPSTISPLALKSDPKEMVNLLYELVRVQITSSININTYPTLLVMKESHEDMKHFVVQSANKLLLRWFIYHLALDKTKLSLDQLASSPSNLIKLFISLEKDLALSAPQSPSVDQQTKESDEFKWIIEQSKQTFNIFQWLTIESIQNRNQKLLYLFLSSIFKSEKGIGIKATESSTKAIEEQRALVEKVNLDVEGTREERAFCMWMNSLNIKPYVNNLQQDLQDGLVILQMFDKIKPGSVNWKEVNTSPSNAYMALENCNYGISIAKQLRFSLVGIGGKDIHDGNRKLTLALIWQACKYHLLSLLTNLRLSLMKDSSSSDLSLSTSSSSSSFFNEGEIIQWANKKVLKHGKSTCITGFKDQSIGNGIFLIDLLDSIQSVVNYSIVTKGETNEEKKLNAQYIINVARKIGCCIFVVWEDLVEVKPKMILTFISMLMCFDQEQQQNLKKPQEFEKLHENHDFGP